MLSSVPSVTFSVNSVYLFNQIIPFGGFLEVL
jgi:hypothetical protein